MVNIIELKDVEFKYGVNTIFDKLNLNIKEGNFVTISGSSGCGKTTLFKILLGLNNYNGIININNIELNEKNKDEVRKIINGVFENSDKLLIEDTVIDNIYMPLKNLKLKKEEINNRIDEISSLLDIKDILEYSTNSLSGGEKQIVSLAIVLAMKPKIILLDEAFSMIDNLKKEKIFKILKKLNKEEKITIINFTNDLEDSLYSKEMCLIDNGKIILNKKLKDAFEDEKIYKKCHLELPFIVNLCLKLKYYNLIDKIIFDTDKLVNELWK